MEALLETQAVSPGRPGWWRTAWALVVGAGLGFCALLVPLVVLGAWAGVAPRTDGPHPGWPFAPAGPAALAADLGFAAFVLAVLTVVTRASLRAWLEDPPAPTWIAAGLGLGGFGPVLVGPLGAGGFWGLLVAVVVIRLGGFDGDGRARGGALAALPPDARRRGRGLVAGILVAGLAWACAYGVAHPVAGASSSGGSGAPLVRGVDPPVRSGFVALEARGPGTVTLLGLRPAGAAAGLTRVVAAGSSPDGVVDGPAGLRPRLPAPVEGGEAWFTVRPCPAATVVVARLEARVRSWSGTRWVAVRVAPAIRLRCAP